MRRPVFLGDPVTTTESNVLAAVASGMKFAAAAKSCSISRYTVKDYMMQLRIKLGARNNHHLIALAVAAGIIESTDDGKFVAGQNG